MNAGEQVKSLTWPSDVSSARERKLSGNPRNSVSRLIKDRQMVNNLLSMEKEIAYPTSNQEM